jgi:hypothetical protein
VGGVGAVGPERPVMTVAAPRVWLACGPGSCGPETHSAGMGLAMRRSPERTRLESRVGTRCPTERFDAMPRTAFQVSWARLALSRSAQRVRSKD